MKEETFWGKKIYSFSSLESIWQRPPGTKTPLCSLLWNLYGTLNGIGMSNKGSWHPPVLTAMSTPWFFYILKFSFSLFSLISGKIAGTNPGTWALILHLYCIFTAAGQGRPVSPWCRDTCLTVWHRRSCGAHSVQAEHRGFVVRCQGLSGRLCMSNKAEHNDRLQRQRDGA